MSSHVSAADGAVIWTAFEVDEPTVAEIVRAVRTGDEASGAPDIPWAAVLCRPDGSTVAAVSTQFAGGLYWARHDGQLTIGDHVADVVAASACRELDADYVIGYLMLDAPADRSPYLGVRRVRPGTSVVLRAGADREVDWLPAARHRRTRPGDARDAVQRYRATFDAAVSAILPADAPLVSTMSAGLDSTMVVATLARLTDRPIVALCHSPLPEAGLTPQGQWDPDDHAFALAMEHAYPGQVRVQRVFASPTDHPLDAALAGAASAWLPVFNPGNQIWMSRMSALAADMGADRLFFGGDGNASFSFDHPYAARHHARHGQFGQMATALTRGRSRLTLQQLAGSIPAWITDRGRLDPGAGYLDTIGVDCDLHRRRKWATRGSYLRFLHPGRSLPAALAAASWPTPLVDPFRSRAVLELAAAIPPAEWRRDAARGFARRVGADRVPDSIRLRTRRGGQSRDQWYLARNSRDRYFDEALAISDTPVLADIVDVDSVCRTLQQWPWEQQSPPNSLQVIAINRLLSLAGFVRLSARRLREQQFHQVSGLARIAAGPQPVLTLGAPGVGQ